MIITTPAHYIYDLEGNSGGYHVALEVGTKCPLVNIMVFR